MLSSTQQPYNFISPRYRLLDPLGAGGMGTVYRAFDRLTGHIVALKRVNVAPEQLQFASRSNAAGDALLLALAQEFKLLASLRHPHIISVLDYGFDALRQPYFTMELLDQPQTLLAAARNRPLDFKINLLIQTLQALTYLHRRGILHHDLKPENVLVSAGQVRVLDFGLAVRHDQNYEDDSFGTLLYLPPEIYEGGVYSQAGDMYAVGVMAYEMLAEQHPFYTDDVAFFVDRVLTTDPDFSALETQPGLVAVVAKLLAKQPESRYQEAHLVIADLCAAIGLPTPEESVAIRESFLQAATFVGREAELERLTGALEQTLQGQGSAWLVGGESGVGKSRLLEEVRTHALVAGATVLRGQAVEEGGLPYQLWREPLRLLAMSTGLSELEAGVLKPIVPDIATLLERAVPDPPALSGAEHVQRLVRVVIDLLRRQEQPLVLLWEDLQWAEESLLLLKEAVRLLADRPILIVGNYRDEERPRLPEEVPGMQVLPLPRLTPAGIAQLSTAMLGESGCQPQVLALLEQETEGNTFFMVEVVRALAEESGRLADIGRATLPVQVFTGGVQRLVQRRLQRVPSAHYGLLQLAAVLGRQIDTAALKVAAPYTDLNRWLLSCAEAQVLEVQGEQWRFAHDKLRAGVLAAVPAEQRAALHLRVAKAIEQTYEADLSPQASRLAEHYRQAGNVNQERHYARQAGDYAAVIFTHAEAVRHFSRALELTEDERGQFEILLRREEVYDWQGDREAQTADLEALATLAEQLDDDRCRFEAAQRRIQQALETGDFPLAAAGVAACVRLAQTLTDPAAEATAHYHWGAIASHQGDLPTAEAQFRLALELARTAQAQNLEADCLNSLAIILEQAGDYASGRTLYEQALTLSRALGDRRREAAVLIDLSVLLADTGDRATSIAYLEQALRLNRMVGHVKHEAIALLNLGFDAQESGDYDRTELCYQQALHLARLNRDRRIESHILESQGALACEVGDYHAAQALLAQALQHTREMQLRGGEAIGLTLLSHLALVQMESALAEQHARAALKITQELGLTLEQQMAWNALGRAQLQQGHPEAAVQSFQAVLAMPSDQHIPVEGVSAQVGLAQVGLVLGQMGVAYSYTNQILDWLERYSAIGLHDLSGVFLACYRVLAAQQDPRAVTVLETGYQELQRRAATISDPVRRQSYLENVRSNRELLATWQERFNWPDQPST